MRKSALRKNSCCFLLIFLCFLWTSCAYLSWLYRLSVFTFGKNVDLLSEVIGYLFQAVGLLFFAGYIHRKSGVAGKNTVVILMVADLCVSVPSITVTDLVYALIFGYVMNLLHGFIAGYYLYRLTTDVPAMHRGTVFGLAYALASIGCYLISLPRDGLFLQSGYILIVYLIIASAAIALILAKNDPLDIYDTERADATSEPSDHGEHPYNRNLLIAAASAVLLLSLVKGLGFAFPFSDVSEGINLIFTRIFYAVGLICAGIISDRNRRYALTACLASLSFPFLLVVIADEVGPSVVVWCISYILTGFFTVYRVLLFSDLVGKKNSYLHLSAAGLLFGRIGDALGSCGCILLSENPVLLMSLSAVLFAATVIVLVYLYQRLYTFSSPVIADERERTELFADKYGLSVREREVLTYIIEGLTNAEMAALLCISENTVKFHVRNILKKTSSENRMALMSLYRKNS